MPQRVALPPVTMSNAGSGDCAVAQLDCPELVLSWHGNGPMLSSRRESQDGEVAPGVHHGVAHPALAQALQGGIDGHAFRDPPKIELDGGRKGHAPAYRVYLYTTPSSSWLPWDNGIETDRLKVIESTVIS